MNFGRPGLLHERAAPIPVFAVTHAPWLGIVRPIRRLDILGPPGRQIILQLKARNVLQRLFIWITSLYSAPMLGIDLFYPLANGRINGGVDNGLVEIDDE